MTWKVIPPNDKNQVVTAVFEGRLSAEEGAASAAAFRAAFGDEPVTVVWDVARMTGFDARARKAWAEVLWSLRSQIKNIKIIGAKGVIRVGATFLAVLIRKPYEFVDSVEADRLQDQLH